MNAKALIIGLISTLMIGLLGQVVFVIIASYVGMAAEDVAWVQEYKAQFWFALGMVAYCASLVIGGMITAYFAEKNAWQTAMTVGGVAAMISVLTSANLDELTYMALVLVGFGLIFSTIGARIYTSMTQV